MGLMLDTSLLIADERGKFDMPGFLRWFPSPQMLISAIAATELLHGIERARDSARRALRQHHVEQRMTCRLPPPLSLLDMTWPRSTLGNSSVSPASAWWMQPLSAALDRAGEFAGFGKRRNATGVLAPLQSYTRELRTLGKIP